jgi:uncharacterized phage protein (predicted DNA packaging)
MSIIPVALLKAHLNLEHDLDDDLLSSQLDAAEAYAGSFVGAELTDPIPPAISQSVLMLAGFWYEHREAAQTGGNAYVVPFGVHDLLQAHRKWAV